MSGGKTRKSVARKSASRKSVVRKTVSRKPVARKSKKPVTRKSTASKKSAVNTFFKLMLEAKRKNLPSFKYKSKTYKGVKHPHLGMIYRKA
jgi:hypothetical protein